MSGRACLQLRWRKRCSTGGREAPPLFRAMNRRGSTERHPPGGRRRSGTSDPEVEAAGAASGPCAAADRGRTAQTSDHALWDTADLEAIYGIDGRDSQQQRPLQGQHGDSAVALARARDQAKITHRDQHDHFENWLMRTTAITVTSPQHSGTGRRVTDEGVKRASCWSE